MKVQASSLFYAIIISLLVGMLSTALIMQKYFHFVEVTINQNEVKLMDNCISGINLLKLDHSIQMGETKNIDLYGKNEDSVSLHKKNWGIYSILKSTAFGLRDSISKTFMSGLETPSQKNYSLFLADHNRPLSICGKTHISGTAFIPESGIKRAYIEGRSYSGDRMIYGTKKTSDSKIPKLDQNWENYINGLQDGKFQFEYEEIEYSTIQENEIIQSFSEKTKVILLFDSIAFDEVIFKGNLIIYSKFPITINRSAEMENIVVISPRIYIQSDAKLQAQFIARELIEVEEYCQLVFPSSILLYGDSKSKLEFKVGSQITGAVILKSKDQKGLINVDKEAKVTGHVYTNGFTQLKGEIEGTLITNKFLLKTPSSVYENHVLDGKIIETYSQSNLVGLPWSNINEEIIVIGQVQ